MDGRKKHLTQGETQVMNILWGLPGQEGFAADIMKQYPNPKPAMTTLLTFLKILKDKGYVSSRKEGRSYLFKAKLDKDVYAGSFLSEVKDTLFGGSFTSLVSFFVHNEKLTDKDIEELKDIVKNLE
ncbi:MAG: BlaI/MecI/CopY family transcriptional regulator [Prevotellaceae bacterium]|nr:BlaI/MecI/CopY family transcriptional regulator [Prevotella sp.]MDD7257699.1 BlaI/MecI/CopY family transcriptional regulator [Prevotellaceae bacterium]MDY6130740.1 BlaI/MecI/CopY family transcriptional regulator [Prevotella sp.]